MTSLWANKPVRMDERIEFGFVLLPKHDLSPLVKVVKAKIAKHDKSSGRNTPALMPHISLGQYGVLRAELPELVNILKEVAKNFKTYRAPMAGKLAVTAENIFFDFKHIKADTDPKLIDLYRAFRCAYMNQIKSRFPIAQALFERINGDEIDVELIDKYYQNWGTPEEHRIRPHITVIYDYSQPQEEVEAMLNKASMLKHLPNDLEFDRIALVTIDPVGNGLKVLAEVQLG